MTAKLLIFLLLSIASFGYDELLLEAQSSVLPKIALLDKDIQKKLIGGKLQIVIACNAADIELAKETAQKIMTATGAKVGAFALNILAVEFSQLSKADASMIYILNSNDVTIKKATQIASQKKIVSFVFDKANLKNGAMLSMSIERSAVITLSRSVMKESGVQFVDSFYKITRIVE